MTKIRQIFQIFCLFLVVITYQNCGDGYHSKIQGAADSALSESPDQSFSENNENLPTGSDTEPSPISTNEIQNINEQNPIKVNEVSSNSCIIKENGQVECINNYTTYEIKNLISDAIDVTGSRYFNCALNIRNQVYCWGFNRGGVFGLPGEYELGLTTPNLIKNLPDKILKIQAGAHFICSIVSPGDVFCWGQNTYNQLSHDMANFSDPQMGRGYTIPTKVPGLPSDIIDIAAGYYHACALSKSGDVYCWGQYTFLGTGGENLKQGTVKKVLDVANAVSLDSNKRQSCAALKGGIIHCWGDQVYFTTSYDVPFQYRFQWNEEILEIKVGYYNTCFLTISKKVVCFENDTVQRVQDFYFVNELQGVSELVMMVGPNPDGAAASSYPCGLKGDGSLLCKNFNGNLTTLMHQ